MTAFELKSIAPSLTVHFNNQVQHLSRSGKTICNLTAGEAKLPTHPKLLASIQKTLETNRAYYPPVAGIQPLRESISAWMNQTYNTSFSPEQCLVTSGGKYGLFILLQALIQPGDEVLIPTPFWTSYPTMVDFFGGKSVLVPTHKDGTFQLSLEAIEKKMSSKSKVLLLNNANNPTGEIIDEKTLEAILAFAEQHNLLVISDEVYSELVYEGTFVSCGSFQQYQDRVVVVQSCSKNFGMTGWRVGFVFAAEEIVRSLSKIQAHSITSASVVSQWAANSALAYADDITQSIQREMADRRSLFLKTFEDVFSCSIQAPSSALYAFLPLKQLGVPSQMMSLEACEHFLHKANVAMVPGIAFGQDDYIRCSFGGPRDEIIKGIEQLKQCADEFH